MRPLELIARAKADGLVIEPEGDRLHLLGHRSAIERWKPALREHKAAVLAELSRPCDRCAVVGERLIPSYWGPYFCPPCCAAISEQHDREGTWPPVSW